MEIEDKEYKQIEAFLEKQKPKVRANATITEAEEDYPYMLHGSINDSIEVFTPRLAERYAKGSEDRTVERVHVAETLVGCIMAMDELSYYLQYNIDEEEAEVFKGGWYIYAIPYQYALKPNVNLVYDAGRSNEVWLVPYSKETKEYKSEIIAKVFLESMSYANLGMDENKNTLRKYITTYIAEVMSKSIKIDQSSNKQYPKGYYKVEITRTTENGHHVNHSFNEDLVRVIKIDKDEYNKKKKVMAPKILYKNKTFFNW